MCRFGIAVEHCGFGQHALAQVVARRLLGYFVENLLRLGVLALGHVDACLEVCDIEEVRHAVNHPVNFGTCLLEAILFVQRPGDTDSRPWIRAIFKDVAIGGFGGLHVAVGEKNLGPLTQAFKAIGAPGFAFARCFENGRGCGVLLFAPFFVIGGEELFLATMRSRGEAAVRLVKKV